MPKIDHRRVSRLKRGFSYYPTNGRFTTKHEIRFVDETVWRRVYFDGKGPVVLVKGVPTPIDPASLGVVDTPFAQSMWQVFTDAERAALRDTWDLHLPSEKVE